MSYIIGHIEIALGLFLLGFYIQQWITWIIQITRFKGEFVIAPRTAIAAHLIFVLAGVLIVNGLHLVFF